MNMEESPTLVYYPGAPHAMRLVVHINPKYLPKVVPGGGMPMLPCVSTSSVWRQMRRPNVSLMHSMICRGEHNTAQHSPAQYSTARHGTVGQHDWRTLGTAQHKHAIGNDGPAQPYMLYMQVTPPHKHASLISSQPMSKAQAKRLGRYAHYAHAYAMAREGCVENADAAVLHWYIQGNTHVLRCLHTHSEHAS